MENPIKIDDLVVPLVQETTISANLICQVAAAVVTAAAASATSAAVGNASGEQLPGSRTNNTDPRRIHHD